MKFTKRTAALIFLCPSMRADDKSCYEEGKYKGDEIEPDGSTSYPEEKKAWDLSDEDYDSQPGICENIRIIMGGVDWTMNRENGKAECKVLSWVEGLEEKNDNIRSVECTEAPTFSPSPSPTLAPTWRPTESPTSSPTLSPSMSPTTNPTVAPTSSPTTNPTVAPTSSPTTAITNNPTTTNNPTKSPTRLPTPSPDAGGITGKLDQQTIWYYIVCAILLSMLCCFMCLAYSWMSSREDYIERKHAKAMDILEAFKKRLSRQERVPSEHGVQMGPNYNRQGSHLKAYRMNSTTRSSTSSIFSTRSSRLKLSAGRTMWRGSIDDCSMNDDEAISRRFSTNPPIREPSELAGYSYSESNVEMAATPPVGSGRLISRGYIGANYNRNPGTLSVQTVVKENENPNRNTFNVNKALKTGVVHKSGSISQEESKPSTPEYIYGDKTGRFLTTEDTGPLVNLNNPGENSEPSASFSSPQEVEIEVKICKQRAPVFEVLEEDEDEIMQRESKWSI